MIRTFSQIVQSMNDEIRVRQPALDTKPGTVARDLLIDVPADQLASVYRDLQLVEKNQSLLNATGTTLVQLGSNFGINKDAGKKAAGNAILTFNTLLNNININSGSTITSKTGVVYRVTTNITISAASKGYYSSYASSISEQLHIAGITDQYAVQVPVEAINVGSNGNIPAYSLIKTSITGISNVTNIEPISGGSNPQNDSQYRNQIIAGLSGSSAGTAKGYKNALSLVSGIQSTYIASAGNPILTRDGTINQRNSDGTLSIVSPGTGGKVDIWIQGNDYINISESYVFHDLSGIGNISSTLNSHILGQSGSDNANLTPLERRQLFTQTGELPLQPVDSLINLTGSVSGSNFIQGVNYDLVKDTNPQTQNTPFALDNIVFLQDFISLDNESVIKGTANSVDTLVFSGIKAINDIYQDIIVVNDLATQTATDHTQITISHTPLTTVLRATNLTTGERYVITDQGLNSSTDLNEDGSIHINGSVLPSAQDLVQVDYTWRYFYDKNVDYFSPDSLEVSTTSVDWGRANYIKRESSLLVRNGNRYNLTLSRSIDRVYNAFYCDTQLTSVQNVSTTDVNISSKFLRQVIITTGSGPVVYFILPGIDLTQLNIVKGSILQILTDSATSSRVGLYTIENVVDQTILQVSLPTVPLTIQTADASVQILASDNKTIILNPTTITGLETTAEDIQNITNVVSVISQKTGMELYATEAGGRFSGNTIYLATDIDQPDVGETVLVYFNSHELFNIDKNNGTLSDTSIILSTDDILDYNSVLQPLNDIFNGISVKPILVNYVIKDADVISRTAISQMPFIGSTSTSNFVNKNNATLTSRQPVEFDVNNKIVRFGPSYLSLTIDNAYSSGGTFAIRGNGLFKISASINVSQNNTTGNFELLPNILSEIGSVSTKYSVVKISSLSLTTGSTTESLYLRGYTLTDNTYDSERCQSNGSLSSATTIDLSSIFAQNNITSLSIGSTLNIEFYVLANSISETIQFTSGKGTLYTKYKYISVNRIDLISGFTNPSNSAISGYLTIDTLSQPITSNTYFINYDYYAPVENERLTITYRYNNIIQDATQSIEDVRTLTADVLTRLAIAVVVNVSVDVILSTQTISQQSQILDQVSSAINNLITSTNMGGTLDYSALLRVATAVNGVSGADITLLDYEGSDFNGIANRKSITVDANQYLKPGNITVNLSSR